MSAQRQRWGIAKVAPLLLIAATITVCSNTLHSPFIFDDQNSVLENASIRHIWPFWPLLFPAQDLTVTARPTANVSLALNYALGKLDVEGYHVFNIAVHALCALVLYGVIRRTMWLRRGTAGWPPVSAFAFAVALLWTVHPLCTEAITYIVQRTESMAVLFMLLTVYCLVRGAATMGSWPQRAWYGLTVISSVLAMGSKESAVAIPFVVLMYDRINLSHGFWRALRSRWGLYLGLAAGLALIMLLQLTAPHRRSAGFGLAEMSAWRYAKTEAGVLLYYLRLAVWPRGQAIDYYDWPAAGSLWSVLPAGLAVVALLGVTAWSVARDRPIAMAGVWFFLLLGPTSSFFPLYHESMAERRTYGPLMGVITLVCAAAWIALRRLPAPGRAWLGGVLTMGLAGVLGVAAWQRNQTYRTARSIWEDAVAKRPHSARALSVLAAAMVTDGDLSGAVATAQQAARCDPGFFAAHENMAAAYAAMGNDSLAERELRLAVRLQGLAPEAHEMLGSVLMRQGQTEQAIAEFKQSLELRPEQAIPQLKLGAALASLGRFAEAEPHLAAAVYYEPDWAKAHELHGDCLAMQQKTQQAAAEYRAAMRLDPASHAAQRTLLGVDAASRPADIK